MAPGWEEVLSRYDVSWAVIPANPYLIGGQEFDLAAGLRKEGWREIYRDDVAGVFERR